MGNTDKSDFGSGGFGKNCICYVIPKVVGLPKMYILSMLEISWVITIPITQCNLCELFLVSSKKADSPSHVENQ